MPTLISAKDTMANAVDMNFLKNILERDGHASRIGKRNGLVILATDAPMSRAMWQAQAMGCGIR